MSNIPQHVPGPTSVDGAPALVQAAIVFAYNPKDNLDAIYLKQTSELFDKKFKENYLLNDPKQIAIATVTAYLKSKTKQSGGKKTYKRLSYVRKTRKHKQR